MKVLLAVPDSQFHLQDYLGIVSLPLGLGYIANYLRQFGNHTVAIYDGLVRRSGAKGFRKILDSFSPDIVGISGQSSSAVYDVYNYAKIVKSYNPQTIIVVGGAHATFQDTQMMKDCPELDVIVRGEGEAIMKKLVDAYSDEKPLTNVPGITFRDNGSIVRNMDHPFIENLDELPFPAYDLINPPLYFSYGVRYSPMVSSRGCPFGCKFCASSKLVGKRWRARSPENVVKEMKHLEDKYNVKEIVFIDDLFTYDLNRVHEICNQICDTGISVGWNCTARASKLLTNPEMLKWLKSAGCHTLCIGVESGSQRILDLMNKGIKLEQVVKSVKMAKDAGFVLVLTFMVGYPGETKQDIDRTIEFACKMDPEIAEFTICTPFPGTELYDQARENGWLKANSWREFSTGAPVMEFDAMTKNCIKRHLIKAYFKFYTRPSYIWRQVKNRNIHLLKQIPQITFKLIKNRKI